jgi:hypothetical protein
MLTKIQALSDAPPIPVPIDTTDLRSKIEAPRATNTIAETVEIKAAESSGDRGQAGRQDQALQAAE